jgi:multidrug efflux pump subunit AcrB
VPVLQEARQVFLPDLDEGRVQISLTADRGVNLTQMDAIVQRVERLLAAQPEVDIWFSQVGGFVFGRSQHEAANRASIDVRLKPLAERGGIASRAWIKRIEQSLAQQPMAGVQVRIHVSQLRGIRFNRGDDDIGLRVQGPDLAELERIANQAVERLRGIEGLRNIQHSSEELSQELAVVVDRARAASFGLSVEDVGKALQLALDGIKVTEYLEGDRSFDVRLRLDRRDVDDPEDIESVVLFSNTEPAAPLRLADLARVELIPAPANIRRDRQQRVINIDASLGDELTLDQALERTWQALNDLPLPPGYRIYDAGSLETLKEGRDLGRVLLGLALFLVFVVMAVQYESLRNPLVIILSVPFALIGVALGLQVSGLPLSMPIWLGLIMLAGIVVNNAIVLVEYIEIERDRALPVSEAIAEAARLRLRPILMTTLTTVVGMLPLALAFGEGSEMLQPLAVTIVAGLSFSTLVSLVLVPCVYRLLAGRVREPGAQAMSAE